MAFQGAKVVKKIFMAKCLPVIFLNTVVSVLLRCCLVGDLDECCGCFCMSYRYK